MPTQRLSAEDVLEGVPASGELATALADVKRLRREAEEKATELDEALERLTELTDQADGSSSGAPGGGRRPLHPVASPDRLASEEALIRATQMAVSGSSRSEIEATLRDEYDVSEAGRIVEQILGPARGAAAKVPTSGSPTASSPAPLSQD